MNAPCVALIVDNPYRDLPGLVLLAWRLAQSGIASYLVPMNMQVFEISALQPDFVLLNYLRANNQHFVQELHAIGVPVGVLDTEGGVFVSFDTYEKTLAPNSTVREKITCYCSWGTKLAHHLVQQGWYRDDQVTITGSPRFDFYHSRWRQAALATSPYADHYTQPLILVNGNFPLVNPQFTTPEEEAHQLVEQFGFDAQYVQEWQATQRQTLQELVDLTNRLAAQFPTVTFIYRPHPFEKLETYNELLIQRDNLYIVKAGTVDGWILRSSAVIQRSCSTAIEASLADVPALSPVWIPTQVEIETAEAVSIPCATYEDIQQHITAILQGHYQPPTIVSTALATVIAEGFHAIDGASHERVATAIVERLEAATSIDVDKWRMLHYQMPMKTSLKSKIGARIRMGLRLSTNWAFSQMRPLLAFPEWDTSQKSFDVQRVQDIITAIAVCQPEGIPISVHTASEMELYRYRYQHGRSVVVSPIIARHQD